MNKATALRHKLRSLSKHELIEELIGALVRVADLAAPQVTALAMTAPMAPEELLKLIDDLGCCTVDRDHALFELLGRAQTALIDALEWAPGVAQQPWQSIETAPKDGTKIDLWHPTKGRCVNAFWQRLTSILYEPSCWSNQSWGRIVGATHWMPVPADPSNQGASK